MKILEKLANKYREERERRGSVVLDTEEVRFDSEMMDMKGKEHFPTCKLVEEWMLKANIAAAERLYEYFPSCALLRRHQSPALSNFSDLRDALKKCGKDFKYDSSEELGRSLGKIRRENDAEFTSLISSLVTRCFKPAKYICADNETDFAHYGLAVGIYTHFTSPIRRYADLIVHRLLTSTLDIFYQNDMTPQQVRNMCKHINKMHRSAQIAGRESTKMYIKHYLKGRKAEGFVVAIGSRAVVYIPKYAYEIIVENKGYKILQKVKITV